MKEFVKGYHMFLPKASLLWLFGIYVLYPLLVILWTPITDFPSIFYMLTGMVVLTIEMVADFTLFGGVGQRNNETLTYILSSGKGLRVLKKGLAFDAVRRLGSCLTIFLGIGLKEELIEGVPYDSGEVSDYYVDEFMWLIALALVVFIVSGAAILLCRLCDIVLLKYGVLFGALGVCFYMYVDWVWIVSEYFYDSITNELLLFLMAALVYGISYQVLAKRMEQQYLDAGKMAEGIGDTGNAAEEYDDANGSEEDVA